MALALYRTYRPGQLSDVIGQDHVTGPLARALDSSRIHHAYLFTGPRGCGKTSSARILARSLNCVEGPTSTPCGKCQSCQDLAPNGPGSLDVIELDAASNRGIDDARELRERAMFAPASSRYRVYILDEAHQLTKDAATALLKVIEEPPAHLVFIFATTEPDKILPTIRSRTHHYPFRLVASRRLAEHLAWVCEQEGVDAELTALSLIARAGAGSVRDALSVLGQVMAGSSDGGLTYEDTIALLGYTDAAVLDEVVAAVADSDGARMFELVDSVVESGHDPRRFVTDLLERWRDLVLLAHVPESARASLFDRPDEEIEVMVAQSGRFSSAELVRAADLVAQGLAELRGATAPRLQLELLCARLLLPGVDDGSIAILTRIDQLERRVVALRSAIADGGAAQSSTTGTVAGAQAPTPLRRATPPAPAKLSAARADSATLDVRESPGPDVTEAASDEPHPSSSNIEVDLAAVAAMWPAVLDALRSQSRVAWTAFAQTAPVSISDGAIAVAFPDQGRITFAQQSHQDERLRNAIREVLKVDLRPDLVLSPDQAKSAASKPDGESTATTTEDLPVGDAQTPVVTTPDVTTPDVAAPAQTAPAQTAPRKAAPRKTAPTQTAPRKIPPKPGADAVVDLRTGDVETDVPSVHDADTEDSGLAGLPLLQHLLGGKVVTESEDA